MTVLLLGHGIATAFMCGLIWLVQIVQYPMLGQVPQEAFVDFHAEYMRRISFVVGPAMLLEAVCALALLFVLPAGPLRLLAVVGVLLLVGVWLSTALLQVPAHTQLTQGLDLETVKRLVHSNWLRTAGWTARAILAGVLIARVA